MMLKSLGTSTLNVRSAAPKGFTRPAVSSPIYRGSSRLSSVPCSAVFKGQPKVENAIHTLLEGWPLLQWMGLTTLP